MSDVEQLDEECEQLSSALAASQAEVATLRTRGLADAETIAGLRAELAATAELMANEHHAKLREGVALRAEVERLTGIIDGGAEIDAMTDGEIAQSYRDAGEDPAVVAEQTRALLLGAVDAVVEARIRQDERRRFAEKAAAFITSADGYEILRADPDADPPWCIAGIIRGLAACNADHGAAALHSEPAREGYCYACKAVRLIDSTGDGCMECGATIPAGASSEVVHSESAGREVWSADGKSCDVHPGEPAGDAARLPDSGAADTASVMIDNGMDMADVSEEDLVSYYEIKCAPRLASAAGKVTP